LSADSRARQPPFQPAIFAADFDSAAMPPAFHFRAIRFQLSLCHWPPAMPILFSLPILFSIRQRSCIDYAFAYLSAIISPLLSFATPPMPFSFITPLAFIFHAAITAERHYYADASFSLPILPDAFAIFA
jgi:hypothetical protein